MVKYFTILSQNNGIDSMFSSVCHFLRLYYWTLYYITILFQKGSVSDKKQQKNSNVGALTTKQQRNLDSYIPGTAISYKSDVQFSHSTDLMLYPVNLTSSTHPAPIVTHATSHQTLPNYLLLQTTTLQCNYPHTKPTTHTPTYPILTLLYDH